MSTPRTDYNPPLTKEIIKNKFFKDDKFILFDVGASQGIDTIWNLFDDFLLAYGFDPLVKEIQRLNQINNNANIHYFDAFITDNNKKLISPKKYPKVWQRTSTIDHLNNINFNFNETFNNNDKELIYSKNKYSLDVFIKKNDIKNIDFIKIDTDGNDIAVLNGCNHLFKHCDPLGIMIECQLHGDKSTQSNTFRNIDRILTNIGYSLFDFEVYRYSRKSLPSKFLYNLIAQTERGQILWGDALYIKDYLSPENIKFLKNISITKKLKLLCIFEMNGLADCAAELIIKMINDADISRKLGNKWLDIISSKNNPNFKNYLATIKEFKNNPKSFFPSKKNNIQKIKFFKSLQKFLIGS